MSVNVLRASGSWWVERHGRAARVPTDATTTAELLTERKAVDAVAAAAEEFFDTEVAALELDSPVTTPCRVVAQMVNYRSHARESGFDPARVQPTFFRKASGSVVGPTSPIVKPAHVRLLDYEVELGLVVGTPVPVGTTVTDATLADFVAGLVVANDVSARDVQLTKGQFYESKSYPTFTPVGPFLTLLVPGELARLLDLRLQLRVDGVLRQDRTVADMIHLPARSLTALARFQALDPGDLVLTGTPGGTALQAPPHVVEVVATLLPPQLKWRLFFDGQQKKPQYLRAGNRVTASIRTPDGRLDLGTQDCTVVTAP
jgi:2-keto-4-pentenoate hydratase/2-oxohepta-3-ene-1,7-dioic acid hydratase in catechol pathway